MDFFDKLNQKIRDLLEDGYMPRQGFVFTLVNGRMAGGFVGDRATEADLNQWYQLCHRERLAQDE